MNKQVEIRRLIYMSYQTNTHSNNCENVRIYHLTPVIREGALLQLFFPFVSMNEKRRERTNVKVLVTKCFETKIKRDCVTTLLISILSYGRRIPPSFFVRRKNNFQNKRLLSLFTVVVSFAKFIIKTSI